MSVPTTAIPGIEIAPFVDNPELQKEVAVSHLDIRFQQRAAGENQFRTNIWDSQQDLREIGIQASYIGTGGNFWIAQDPVRGRVAGFVGLKRTGVDEAELKRLAVLTEYRRRGIARALVGRLVQWADDIGIETINLTTGIKENGKPLYEEFGFIQTGFDEDHDDWIMERRNA